MKVEHDHCVKHRCSDCHRIFDNAAHGPDCPHCGDLSMCAVGGECQ